jgi:hypothetical protein
MREDVKDLLHRAADWYRPTPIEPEELGRRPAQSRRRGRVAAAAVALAVFAAGGALTWTAFRPSHGVGPGDTKPRPDVSATVHGAHLTYPGSWTLVDLWPLAGSIASWPEPSGSAIDIPEGTPERGGLPILQLSNDDLGLKSVCRTDLQGAEAVLYVALNGGPYRVNANGSPIWSHELTEGDGPCGHGWYAYRATNSPQTSVPYLVFARFGPEVTPADRDALFRAFDSLAIAPFDYRRPPAESSPRYVESPGATPAPAAPGDVVDVGLQERLCVPVDFSGDVDGDGIVDQVWLGARTLPNGACPVDPTKRRVLVVDLHQDGSPDVVSTVMDCSTWCVLFTVADLNGDGIAEILVNEGHMVPPVSALIAVYELRSAKLESVAFPDGENRFGLQNSWQGYSGAFCEPDGTLALWSGETDDGGALRTVGWYRYRLNPTALRFEPVGTRGPTRTHKLPPSTGYDGHLCGTTTLPIG